MKELLQVKSVLPFGEISERIGQQRILRELEERVATAIVDDTQRIIIESLAEIESALFIETLQQLHREIQRLPVSTVKSSLSQQLRFLILVIKNRLEQITLPEPIQETLEQITQDIGCVPELNTEVILPSPQFLPRNFEKTVKTWEKIIWEHPSRESREERLEFFSLRRAGHRVASVRLHLIAMDEDDLKKEEALSYAEADFYHVRNLQADHLQPSEDIVKRQMELIVAMNLDPIFRTKMLREADGKGYFKERKGMIYGTKRFYMEYHNCIGNLWLISTAEGLKKGSINPIVWLREHRRFGELFFDNIGGQASINRRRILYETKDRILLAEAARIWFRKQYSQEITAAGYVAHQIKNPLLKQVEQVERRGRKRRKVKLMAKIATAAGLVEGSSSTNAGDDSDRSSSLGSSDADITSKNLELMGQLSEKRRAAVRAKVDDTARDYIDEIKRRRKAENLKKAVDKDDGDEVVLRARLTRGGK